MHPRGSRCGLRARRARSRSGASHLGPALYGSAGAAGQPTLSAVVLVSVAAAPGSGRARVIHELYAPDAAPDRAARADLVARLPDRAARRGEGAHGGRAVSR